MSKLLMFLSTVTVLALGYEPPGATLNDRNFQRLFIIDRSTNANELIYEARLDSEGLYTKDPVRIYWIMRTKGGVTESLNGFESHSVYGIDVRSAQADLVIFSLKAMSDRPITVHRVEESGAWKVYASMLMLGEECYLDKIFIEVGSGSLFPRVSRIKLYGRSLRTGQNVSEEIIPN
jgi:hypothetical protein